MSVKEAPEKTVYAGFVSLNAGGGTEGAGRSHARIPFSSAKIGVHQEKISPKTIKAYVHYPEEPLYICK